MITAAHVRAAAKARVNDSNLNSVMIALDRYGAGAGLDMPHRAVAFLAQLMHESGSFRYDREIWGPTAAQARYDTRTDLGNTPEKDGDGYKNRGRGPIQVTGGYNIRAFHAWCKARGMNPPDFLANPDLINTDPWEGLSAIWYWDEGNPDRKTLNRYADRNDPEMITRRINGGLNGYADRVEYYTRLGLVVLGFQPADLRGFQGAAKAAGHYKGNLDGLDGPQTRSAIHMMLTELTPATRAKPAVQAAPVVEKRTVEVDKPTVPATVEQGVKRRFNLFGWISGAFGGGGLGVAGLAGMNWQAIVAIGGVLLVVGVVALLLRQQIIAGIRDVRQVVEAG